jgi:hypothetical protein
MNRTIVHVLILAGAGVATYIVSWGLETAGSSEHAPVVVTLPQRKSAPDSHGPAGRVHQAAAIPADRQSLVRELQRELRRVGCYDGDVNGVWTTSTRMGMQAFIDDVNAMLPIEAPDDVQLSLLRGHKDGACAAPCPQGQQANATGLCTPTPLATRAERSERSGAERLSETSTALAPTAAVAPLLPSPPVASRLALAASRDEGAPPARPERARVLPATAQPPTAILSQGRAEAGLGPTTQQASQQNGPIPPQGIHEGRRRRHVHRAPSRPPKFLRSFVSTVQRSLAPFGIR